MTIDNTINRLKQIITDKNCERMNKSTLKGFWGELIVRRQLESEGFVVEHYGNQAGYDLFIKDQNLKIDVKTSVLKDEFKWGIEYWGWALVHESKQKEITATHFVCLGCDRELNAKIFVVIPTEITRKFPKGIRQFSKVKHGLIVFPDKQKPNPTCSEEARFLKSCDKLQKTKQIKVISNGKKLFS